MEHHSGVAASQTSNLRHRLEMRGSNTMTAARRWALLLVFYVASADALPKSSARLHTLASPEIGRVAKRRAAAAPAAAHLADAGSTDSARPRPGPADSRTERNKASGKRPGGCGGVLRQLRCGGGAQGGLFAAKGVSSFGGDRPLVPSHLFLVVPRSHLRQ